MANDGHVRRSIAVAQSRLVFAEHDVQSPVQVVLDPPMATYHLTEHLRGQPGRAQIITRFAPDLTTPFDFGFHPSNHGETGKFLLPRIAPIRDHPANVVTDGVAPDRDTA